MRLSFLFVFPALLLLVSCGRVNGFDIRSKDAFVSSCVASSDRLGAKYNISPRMVSRFFMYAAKPPAVLDLSREFSPTAVFVVPSYVTKNPKDSPASLCSSIWPNTSIIADVGPDSAMDLGIQALASSLSSDLREVRLMRGEIASGDARARDEYLRIRENMHNYSPRVSAYRVLEYHGRRVPSIVMEAANAVGKPIDAFLVTVTLVGPDGSLVGKGRVRFNVPVPLGPGQESSYVLNLAGVEGLDSPDVVDYPGQLKANISLDDIIAEGTPILERYGNDVDDKKRLTVLSVIESEVFFEQNRLSRVRVALALRKK